MRTAMVYNGNNERLSRQGYALLVVRGRCALPDLATIDARLADLAAMHRTEDDPVVAAAAHEVWSTRLDLLLDERLRLTASARP